MSITEDSDDNWASRMEGLCIALDVDSAAAKKSIESFLDVKGNFTLDVSIFDSCLSLPKWDSTATKKLLLDALKTFGNIFQNMGSKSC